jgi:hypothetical protein
MARNMEQKEDKRHYCASQGKVEIETPSPGNVCSKCAAYQRPEHLSNSKHGTKEPLILRPFVKWNSVDNDHDLMHRSVSKFDENRNEAWKRRMVENRCVV